MGGKGALGFVTKPAIGVFDLASNVSESIRNTTTVFDGDGLDRVRFTRFMAQMASYAHTLNAKHLVNSGSSSWTTESTSTSNISHTVVVLRIRGRHVDLQSHHAHQE